MARVSTVAYPTAVEVFLLLMFPMFLMALQLLAPLMLLASLLLCPPCCC